MEPLKQSALNLNNALRGLAQFQPNLNVGVVRIVLTNHNILGFILKSNYLFPFLAIYKFSLKKSLEVGCTYSE